MPFLTPRRLSLAVLLSLPMIASAADGDAADASTNNPSAKSASGRNAGRASASDADGAVVLKEVVVSGKAESDTDQRRNSTAAKIVIGREELDRYGDSTLSDVLKRLPGVTVGGAPGGPRGQGGGNIRMRGMGGGYTMIMLNGEPAPRGFSIEDLTPDQVERIEIMRAPVAEHSARAIAGAINIVLKEAFVRRENVARPSVTWEKGKAQPSLSLERADKVDNFSYNINANVGHRDVTSGGATETRGWDLASGTPTLLQYTQTETNSVFDNLNLASRLNWKLDGGDSLSVMPFLMQNHSSGWSRIQQEQPLGTTPSTYASAESRSSGDSAMFRTMSNWTHRLDDGAKLDIRLNIGGGTNDSKSNRQEYDASGALLHTYLNNTSTDDNSVSTAAKYAKTLAPGHTLSFGLEMEQARHNEDSSSIQDGVERLAQYGNGLTTNTRRYALYGQNEWDINPLWSAYAGLRWESIRTRSEWAGNAAETDSSVASPLLHSVWRFSEESKDQIRLSLTRSYKSPPPASLVPRPQLSASYPVTGGNLATSPDSAGNPYLKPELAWGLDLAFEHYFTEGGLTSVNLFQRNISDLIRNVTSLQTVDWSPVQRWVTTPQNVGNAVARGIELEAKFRLSELMAGAPPLDLRTNYSRFWSKVDGIPGPNNRLDQQPTWTANLGADYRFTGLPLTLGGNLNWTPAYTVQQTDNQAIYQNLKRIYDVYALWRFDSSTQLRVSASNLLHADYASGREQTYGSSAQTTTTVASTWVTLAARLEVKF